MGSPRDRDPVLHTPALNENDPGSLLEQGSISSDQRSSLKGHGRSSTSNNSTKKRLAEQSPRNVHVESTFSRSNSTDYTNENEWIKVPNSRRVRTAHSATNSSHTSDANNATPSRPQGLSVKQKSKWLSPPYTEKLAKKTIETANSSADKPTDISLMDYYDYCTKEFAISKTLRKPTKMEIEIMHLLRDRKLELFKLPTFLNQIFPLKKIGFFEAFLKKRNGQELFVQLAPGTKLPKNIPDYALRLHIHTSGTVPHDITAAIAKFQADVDDVYYLSQKRFIVFSFKSKEVANGWIGKYIPYQNKPLKLQQYFNNERHQDLPPNDLGEKIDLTSKTKKERQLLLAQVKTLVPYSFLLTNVSPIIKLRHLILLFSDILHLDVGRINNVVNSSTGLRQKSTWEVTLLSEGIPTILHRKTCIKWSHYAVHIFHNKIHTTYPCTNCCAATHIYASCPNKTSGKMFVEQILRLEEDIDLPNDYEETLPPTTLEQDWEFLMSFRPIKDKAYDDHISHELDLHKYGLKQDIDKRVLQRAKIQALKLEQAAKKAKKKTAQIRIVKQKQRLLKQTAQQRLSAEVGLNRVFNIIDAFLAFPKDKYALFLIPDFLFMQSRPRISNTARFPPVLSRTQLAKLVDPTILVHTIKASEQPLPGAQEVLQSPNQGSSVVCGPQSLAARSSLTVMNTAKNHRNASINSTETRLEKWLIKATTFTGTTNCSLSNLDAERQLMSEHDDMSRHSSEKLDTQTELPSSQTIANSISQQSVEFVKVQKSSSIISESDFTLSKNHLLQAGYQQAEVPGNGHCLWVALLLGHYCRKLSHFPILSDLEEENLFEIKHAIADHVNDVLDKEYLNIYVPTLDCFQLNGTLQQMSARKRKDIIVSYFRTIASTDSNQTLTAEHWGSSSSIDLASAVLKRIIYVITIDRTIPVLNLQKFDFISSSSEGVCTSIPLSEWGTELAKNAQNSIVLRFQDSNHFSVYLKDSRLSSTASQMMSSAKANPVFAKRISKVDYLSESDEESTSVQIIQSSHLLPNSNSTVTEPATPNDSSADQLPEPVAKSRELSDSSDLSSNTEFVVTNNLSDTTCDNALETEESDESCRSLSGFSDLSSTTQKIATKEYLQASIGDVEEFAEHNNVSPRTADKLLMQQCKTSAAKQRLEQQIWDGVDVDSSTSIADSDFTDTTPTKTRNHASQVEVALSPGCKILLPTPLIQLEKPELLARRKNLLNELSGDCHDWLLRRHKHSKTKEDLPKIPSKPSSFKFYQKWAKDFPELLLEIVRDSIYPVLLLRQFPLNVLHTFGEYLALQFLQQELLNIQAQMVVKKHKLFISDWLRSVNFISLRSAQFVAISSRSKWKEIQDLTTSPVALLTLLQDLNAFKLLMVVHASFPSLCSRLTSNTSYVDASDVSSTLTPAQVILIATTNAALAKAVTALKQLNWSQIRCLLKGMGFPRCVVFDSTPSY